MKIFRFRQNNSGGRFVINDEVSVVVYIYANNANEANAKAELVGIYFDGCEKGIDCPCCGDRWSRSEDKRNEVKKLPDEEFDFTWCNYVIVYKEDMKPIKIEGKKK